MVIGNNENFTPRIRTWKTVHYNCLFSIDQKLVACDIEAIACFRDLRIGCLFGSAT